MESERPKLTAKPMTTIDITNDGHTNDGHTNDRHIDDCRAPRSRSSPSRGCLRELLAQLDSANEMVLDFSSVRRIDAQAVHALEELAALAEAKGARSHCAT